MTTAKKASSTRSRPASKAKAKAKAVKKAHARPPVKAKPRPAPKAKAPARPAKPRPRAPQGFGPNVPDLGCQDPTLGQVVDLRHCEVPPGKKRKKCSTVRSVVVGCAEPSADKPKRKQMYVVPEGRRYIVPQAEVRKELRAGERARTRLGLPERACEDYTAARARGIGVSSAIFDGDECARYSTPEPTTFAPRADDPWEQVAPPVVAPVVHAPATAPAPGLSTDPRLERWVREYMTNSYANAYDAQEALDSLTRLSGSVVFARAMVAGWTALLRHTPNPSETDLVGLIRDAYAEAQGAKANGRRAAAHGDLPPLAAWRLDKHGHALLAHGKAWPHPVSFEIGPVFDQRRRLAGYAVSIWWRGAHEIVMPSGQIVPNTPVQARHLVRSPQAGLTAARKAWASVRSAKANDAHKAEALRGVALRDGGKDPLIGRRVGGEDFTGFVRAPAVGCDGRKAYVVGGEVEPRSKVLAAIRKAEIAAGLRPPPPPRKGSARPSSPVRAPAPPFRAPLGLPAPGQTSHQARTAESFGPGSPDLHRPRPSAADVADRVAAERSAEDWARAEPGNVVEFQATRRDGKVETRESKIRGVVRGRVATDPSLGVVLEVYGLQYWDRDEHRWIARDRQDSLRLPSYLGRLEIVAGSEPLARELPDLMARFHRLHNSYTALHRTLPLRESDFGALPLPEARADIERYEARLAEVRAEASPVPVSRVDAKERRPLPPRVGLTETRDPSPAWDLAQVGDAVIFRPRATNQVKLRGRIAALVVKADGRTREGIAIDHAERFEANRWKAVPVTERFIIYNTKGSLEITKVASGSAAPRRAGDEAALMQQFETVREQLSFYGAEGVAPAVERFAAMTIEQATTTLARLQARLDAERVTVKAPPANDEPDFGAFITGAKPNGAPASRGRWSTGPEGLVQLALFFGSSDRVPFANTYVGMVAAQVRELTEAGFVVRRGEELVLTATGRKALAPYRVVSAPVRWQSLRVGDRVEFTPWSLPEQAGRERVRGTIRRHAGNYLELQDVQAWKGGRWVERPPTDKERQYGGIVVAERNGALTILPRPKANGRARVYGPGVRRR